MTIEREQLTVDVLIIGAGPAGLSAAIQLKQCAMAAQRDLSVCVLEKGSQVGSHIISGAVFETRALDELLPHWRELDPPIDCPVTRDAFYYFSQRRAWRLPTPPQMRNHGNHIISLGLLCRWLATQAENLGVEIYAGFAGQHILFNDDKTRVLGVQTSDMGITKTGEPGPQFQPGLNLFAKQTLLAEGCRGHLTQTLIKHFQLDKGRAPQTYGLGIKEIWEVDSPMHETGLVSHSVGWPLDHKTYGGSFVYHLPDNRVSVGFVVGLDYQNPTLSPFEEMQRFKTHPAIARLLTGGRRLFYGARCITEGGYQALPKLTMPGACLIGDGAGFLNVPKIKGSHTAMKSGMLAAKAVFDTLDDATGVGDRYPAQFERSWLKTELYRARNIRPSFHWGLWPGITLSALDTFIFRGRAPWTWTHKRDRDQLQKRNQVKAIDYPKPDNVLTFDRLSSVYLTNTYHEDNQPCHLLLTDATDYLRVSYQVFGSPEQFYCPAAVYEIVYNKSKDASLQINAQNCIHCKCCDIKDPSGNLRWIAPQGGEGPGYEAM